MPATKIPIAAFDLDGTLHRGNLVSQLCEQLCHCGYFNGLYAHQMINLFIERDQRVIPYRTYEEKLIKLLLVALRGKSQSQLQHHADQISQATRNRSYVFTRTLFDLVCTTHDCIAITGGLQETAESFAAHWGFNACFSSVLEVRDDHYTGRVVTTPIKDKSVAIKSRLKKQPHLTLNCSIGIGDTISDVTMLESTERQIAFNPDQGLTAWAKNVKWPIVIERKDMIYVLQCGTCLSYPIHEALKAVRSVLNDCRKIQ
jgi:HAD superfamily phosphoserine phosphatase-like hydrolase